jgi:hypothetical protein
VTPAHHCRARAWAAVGLAKKISRPIISQLGGNQGETGLQHQSEQDQPGPRVSMTLAACMRV